MEKENESNDSEIENKEKEKIRSYLEEMAQDKKTPVAKDLVELKHVEVKKKSRTARKSAINGRPIAT